MPSRREKIAQCPHCCGKIAPMHHKIGLTPHNVINELRGIHLDCLAFEVRGKAPMPVWMPLQAVRSASAGGKPDRNAALAIIAAAVAAPISPEAAISPARHAAQKV